MYDINKKANVRTLKLGVFKVFIEC